MSTDPYTRFQLTVLRTTRQVAEALESGECLETACILGSKDGGIPTIHPLEEMDLSETQKILKTLFLKEMPDYAALVFPTVMVALPYKESDHPMNELATEMWREFGIDDTPNTREVILVEVSDGKDPHTYSGEVERRTDHPPSLGEWLAIQNIEGTPQRTLTAAFAAVNKRRKKRWK